MSLISVSSAETVANIEDLLTQILKSLPPSSLYTSRCVSKHWHTLIPKLLKPPEISGFFSGKQGFQFVPLIADHEISSSLNPFKTLNKKLPANFSYYSKNPQLDILQSCNGLFLCYVQYNHISHIVKTKNKIYVVNPTTNRFLVLRPPSRSGGLMLKRCILHGLVFDPSNSPHYKVVCVTIEHMGTGHRVDIYSSGTRDWQSREMSSMHAHIDFGSTQGSVYCNGAIHWISHYSRDLLFYDFGETTLAFTPYPTSTTTTRPTLLHRYFGESGGYLYLIDTYEHCRTQFEVMEMERDYSCWVVKYFVDLDPVIATLPQHDEYANGFVVLHLSREQERDNDEEDSSSLLLHMPGKVLSYNCRNKTFKTCVDLTDSKVVSPCYPYVKSLASVSSKKKSLASV